MSAILRFPLLIAFAAILTALTIVGHEIAHYVAAVATGAENVKLHWADVTFQDGSLGNNGIAITWIAGPIFTHAIILWVLLTGTSQFFALALGLGAASRNLVLIPFTLKLSLGRDVSTFTNDEITVAKAVEIAPISLALVAVLLGLSGLIVFLTRAYRRSKVVWPLSLVLGSIAGILLWGAVGPALLPGGKGFG